ncbi:hypothetical protein Ahy_A01g001130 isoform B [Arachis hypogaea]|uniref:Uncharacterized protein n=1 Tax=Arachis hypogaea TaxID=3818 RepID=A0A445EM75_ARAHY|nr:hypothetical protein Ahy_A01g001130 isoform B [Arachis hypogaea]
MEQSVLILSRVGQNVTLNSLEESFALGLTLLHVFLLWLRFSFRVELHTQLPDGSSVGSFYQLRLKCYLLRRGRQSHSSNHAVVLLTLDNGEFLDGSRTTVSLNDFNTLDVINNLRGDGIGILHSIEKCRKNAINRSKQLYTHTGGSKIMARKRHEERVLFHLTRESLCCTPLTHQPKCKVGNTPPSTNNAFT